MELKIRALDIADDIGVAKKSISLPGSSITTPTKSIKCINIKNYPKEEKINEISKRINLKTLENFHEKEGFSNAFCKNVKNNFLPDCFNFVFFYLIASQVPSDDLTTTLAHVIYPASDKVICLPSVQKGMLMSPTPSGKSQRLDDKKVSNYLHFQEKIIDAVNLKNSKLIMGMIPILPPKYTKQIIDLYFRKGISNFVIDSGTGNIFNKETNLRSILDSINTHAKEDNRSLADTYIHAINLGINHFSADEVSADDFLSLFAYIDTFGTKFKTRGKFDVKTEPRYKVFLRERYAYKLLDRIPENDPLARMKKERRYTKIIAFNEQQQFAETIKVKEMVGNEKMERYIKSKRAVSEVVYKKLRNIFSKIKIG